MSAKWNTSILCFKECDSSILYSELVLITNLNAWFINVDSVEIFIVRLYWLYENINIEKAELQGLRAKLDSIVDAKNTNGKWKYRDTLGEGKYKSIDEVVNNLVKVAQEAEANNLGEKEIAMSMAKVLRSYNDKLSPFKSQLREQGINLNDIAPRR